MKAIATALFAVVLAACGSKDQADRTRVLASPLAGVDGGAVEIGTPCTPDAESQPAFTGAALGETSVESSPGSPSGAPVCLTYHFQGRTACPYGQAGDAGAGAGTCTTPSGQTVTGDVAAQCTDRRAADDVVWSCRCADPDGRTDNGTYCDCPGGTTCIQTVASIGNEFPTLVGAYCVPLAARYDAQSACTATCDPVAHPCP